MRRVSISWVPDRPRGGDGRELLGLPHAGRRAARGPQRQQLVGYVGGAVMGDFTNTLSDAGRDRPTLHGGNPVHRPVPR